ncbi:MAG: phage tail protein [Lachnospiraceae bacterium]|nr:phage tail protein [Lachnospiraceae bacterium]
MSRIPLINTAFQVNIGSLVFHFARIKNISEIVEVETVQEGGNNWSVHNLAKPISSSHKLILERGFKADEEPERELRAGSRVYDVTIMVMEHGEIMKTYSINSGIVTRWEISDLDGLGGQIIYNTIEILHDGLR